MPDLSDITREQKEKIIEDALRCDEDFYSMCIAIFDAAYERGFEDGNERESDLYMAAIDEGTY